MRRLASFLGLLLPLTAGAAPLAGPLGQGDTADHSRHAWPVTEMLAAHASGAGRFPFIAGHRSTEQAVRTLLETKAQPPSTAPASLLHVDLSRRVRFAMLTAPRLRPDEMGHPMLAVALLSLKW